MTASYLTNLMVNFLIIFLDRTVSFGTLTLSLLEALSSRGFRGTVSTQWPSDLCAPVWPPAPCSWCLPGFCLDSLDLSAPGLSALASGAFLFFCFVSDITIYLIMESRQPGDIPESPAFSPAPCVGVLTSCGFCLSSFSPVRSLCASCSSRA